MMMLFLQKYKKMELKKLSSKWRLKMEDKEVIEKIKEWLKQEKILSAVKINNMALLYYIEKWQKS